jgi:colicin import membrane protein
MHAVDDRLAFAPPPQPGLLRGFGLAVVAHLLLVLALMHGLQWQRESQASAVEAELWSALPQQAAPREEPAPPPPPPQQTIVRAPPQPEPPVQRDADIALEKEKHKRELQQRRQAELEREREQRRKLEAQKKREDELVRRKQEQQKLAAETKRKEEDKKRKQQTEARDTKVREQIREEAMRRNAAMAGTGAPSSTGTAARSSGPSASWGGRVQARVRPNIVFTDDIGGNPKAEVEVRMAPDGTIIGKRLVRSSGVKAWDEAVLRALDKTEVLPRDVDGTVPGSVLIEFRPRG